jgi:hypothetical protein
MSEINYLSINENFPVAGQDNDTQVFRDNFDTIKNSLRISKEEITDLQDNTAKTNEDNDFQNKQIARAVFINNIEQKFDGGTISSNFTVDYENGNYQILKFSVNSNIDFLNFPINSNPLLPQGVGTVKLELYGDGSGTKTLNFFTSGGTILKKSSDFPTPFTLTSSTDPVFIEVWQHSTNFIFVRYLGQFS